MLSFHPASMLIKQAVGALQTLRTHLTQTLSGLRVLNGTFDGKPRDLAFFAITAGNLTDDMLPSHSHSPR